MHVIALTLHTFEPFTPQLCIQGSCGKNVLRMCHRPASLGHEEQSSGASLAQRPAPSEKGKICLYKMEIVRHPDKGNLGWKAKYDSDRWGKVTGPILWFIGKLCPAPGARLLCLCLMAPTMAVTVPTVPIPCQCFPCNAQQAPSLCQEHRNLAWPRLCAPSAWSRLQKQLS